jgi:lipopolysaccharide/colanic/teichoic acid biosynthesis glycosyltransferase
MASTGWSGAAASPNEIPKMTSSNQVTILDSTFDRDGPKVMFGIAPRIRRIFEFAAAATGAVLLAPIFLMAAIAIKLDSPGPIFIRDSQLGPSNRVVQVFRFRLATTRAKKDMWQRPNWIALVLGGTDLDRLPQLFNVLIGEMSLADLLRAIGRDGVFLP